MEKDKIARINELAHLAKERDLTDDEKNERAALRAEYIKEIRASFGSMLDNTVIERPDGSRERLQKNKK
ncbi:MAG: DUF896 domain-containing protein [Ruminococcaceae bacterium]|nr:DUF896 domain-containing protein [Oscillospiraceae bacterium]